MSLILLGILNSQVTGGGAGAYDLLETQVLSSSAASVTFTGLGSYSDYKHLQIRAVAKSTASFGSFRVRMNGATGSVYADHRLQGDGSVVESYNNTSATSILAGRIAGSSGTSVFGPIVLDVLDFSSTNKNTTIRSLSVDNSNNFLALSSGLYNSTSAVTSINIFDSNGNLSSGSRFSLYGIRG